ncbi:chemotaxis protein CheX [Paludibacterium sp.]|uniref:chemotaxis protein CheX n=1 Tax=Paludibacterium sp. TaxID=1917523 RepID=UPI0025FDF753|nr:chemotaxis protein CheX [Paludibacterium sp.]MBV8645764.1 chemotaxis protein CheX [Paludibacterium sp.]
MGRAETMALQSKILVLDGGGAYRDSLSAFCRDNGLIGIRPQQPAADSVMAILGSNVDLGGILLYEHHGGKGAGLALGRRVHALRPELPIFLRRDGVPSLAGLGEDDALMFCCAYTLADLGVLKASLASSIFSRFYPNDLVRNITDMSRQALGQLFPHCDVDVQAPWLAVKDRTVYGEMFSLIAIESNWCRGTMMLQAEVDALQDLLAGHPARPAGQPLAADELDGLLGEATNLIWGSFKNRYAGGANAVAGAFHAQVPIIVNQRRRAVSFGSDDPQLCLRYQLRPRGQADAAPLWLVQRFVFNLCWAPDEFTENPTVESLVEAGELELF